MKIGSVTIDPLNYRTTVLHDALGRVTSYTDAANNTTTYAFDASGRLTSQTDPLGKTTTSVYDAAGRLTALTDRLGREKLFLYDALGRMTSQIWENSGGTPFETLAYSFDANGNMLSAGNSNGTYTVTYDNLNRPSTAQDMWSNTLTMGYDALGNRTSVEDSHGGLTTSVYDAINNLTQRKFSDGSSNVRVDHLYDANGRVTATSRYSDLAGSSKVADSTYGYDDGGRLTRIQHTDSSAGDIANYTQTYDGGNRLTNVEWNTILGTSIRLFPLANRSPQKITKVVPTEIESAHELREH